LSKWAPASRYNELEPELGQTFTDSEAAVRPVGFWPRVGAYLIDVMVLQGIFLAIWGPVPEVPGAAHGIPDFGAIVRELGPRLAYQIVIQLAYTVILNGQFGATLGKLAIGARIVNVDNSPIGFGKALLRWVAMIASNLTLGIGYLIVAFRPDKRALHDLLAGTKVIYRR
jgi:uncharacterized RDD family membrane protein YckC